MSIEELCLEIDELCEQGLNSSNAMHHEAALNNILTLVRKVYEETEQ